ncbi:MAG: hypothetical protein ACLUE2_12095 [Bacteroides cellulosilyticus]
MKLILFLLILGGLTLIVYGAASLLFVALGRMPGVKNSLIAKLEYVYMIHLDVYLVAFLSLLIQFSLDNSFAGRRIATDMDVRCCRKTLHS